MMLKRPGCGTRLGTTDDGIGNHRRIPGIVTAVNVGLKSQSQAGRFILDKKNKAC